VYVGDKATNRVRVVAGAAVSTLLGTGAASSTDGTLATATLQSPTGVGLSPNGTLLYVCEANNGNRIKVVNLVSGAVRTFAGSGVAAYRNGIGTAAAFFAPNGLYVAPSGMVYVADTNNFRVRSITPAAAYVTVLAGSGASGSADGIGTAAAFAALYGITGDASGILYIGDTLNNRVRRLDPASAAVTTLGFAGGCQASLDGPAYAAAINHPEHLVALPDGTLVIAEHTGGGRIRAYSPLSGGAVSTLVGGAGKDVLRGGDGADRFVFDTALGASNVDTINDFLTGTDKIVLSAKVFSKFIGSSAGIAITTANLVVGAVATAVAKDADDYLIYDTASDLLFYDTDGSGSGAPVAFVKVELAGTAAPAFGDFLVVT
jgi:DNA-binding beta-propeller fold protein YncE